MSCWEEALGQTQNSLEGLFVPSGLGMPRDPQEELKSVSGERDAWVSLLNLLPPDKQMTMDGWILKFCLNKLL